MRLLRFAMTQSPKSTPGRPRVDAKFGDFRPQANTNCLILSEMRFSFFDISALFSTNSECANA